MSKIVILVGSMRKGGNTELLASAFADGAKHNHNVEIISVADYKVNYCIGCNSCFTSKNNKCFQNDDMNKIYDKLKDFILNLFLIGVCSLSIIVFNSALIP